MRTHTIRISTCVLSRYMAKLISCLVFLSAVLPGTSFPAGNQTAFKPLFPVEIEHDFPEPEKTFENVKNLILEKYYSDDITEKALYWAAIQGMLRHISPPENPDLSRIWTPDEYEKVLQALKGIDLSIGIKSSFNPNDGSLTVTNVFSGSPADSILKPFDRIMRINSLSLKDKSLAALNALLKGKEGTDVTLTISRDIQVFDVTLKRKTFETETLIVSRPTDTVALLEIKSFTANLSGKLKDELRKLKNDGFTGLIIDLRNNSGGLLNDALRTVELFLPEKSVLLRTLQRNTGLQNYVSSN
ncbi:MAG: PDZ domain-containing protein, partial [Deltaproteobacteria bacterium]|nr:PDZ domain-containing protein [Deltaproteobacteria bacterium]